MAVAAGQSRRHRLAELLGISHDGRPEELSERDVREQIYGERPSRNGYSVRRANGRPRDARGRFVSRSTASRNGR